jgi:hypothetical protein
MLKPRKSHPQQLTANHQWEAKERHHLSHLSGEVAPSPPFSTLRDYDKASPITTPKLHLKKPSGPIRASLSNELLISIPQQFENVDHLYPTN